MHGRNHPGVLIVFVFFLASLKCTRIESCRGGASDVPLHLRPTLPTLKGQSIRGEVLRFCQVLFIVVVTTSPLTYLFFRFLPQDTNGCSSILVD